MPLDASLEINGENAVAFEEWREALPDSHGPAISEWVFRVEVAKGIEAEIRVLVPSWDEYRTAEKTEKP